MVWVARPQKTKSITFEIIGSHFETSPIFLDVTGAWMSSVINTSLFYRRLTVLFIQRKATEKVGIWIFGTAAVFQTIIICR